MAIKYEYIDLFIDDVFKQFDIKEILEEDVSSYIDCEVVPQIYFVNKDDLMVAHWNLYEAVGYIREYISKGSHWSKSRRKFKKLKKQDLDLL